MNRFEYRLTELLKRLRPRALKDRGVDLNSPFVVTLLGGLMLSVIGSVLQYKIAEHERSQAMRTDQSQRKEKVAYDFANEIPITLNVLERLKRREVWFIAQGFNHPTAKFKDGRTFQETRDQYEKLQERYLAQKPVASLCNQVAGCFHSVSVSDLAVMVNTNVDRMIEATNENQIDEGFRSASKAYRDLTRELFSDLNGSK
jgi:hypothetical protein